MSDGIFYEDVVKQFDYDPFTMAEEIVRLRKIVATYGQIEVTWPEKQFVTAIYTHVPTAVLKASDNPRELFTEALERGMKELIDYVEQRRSLHAEEGA